MRLLLDTHVFIWWQEDSPRLGRAVRDAIGDAAEVHVSAATSWEIAIKVATGRLKVPEPPIPAVLANGFLPLDITFAHAERAGALPFHHGDPFDRMLVAQAQAEGLVLVTADGRLSAYEVALLRA